MKKVMATVMAAVCVLGMTGCAGGGKFKSISSKIQKAASNDCSAEEASKKQKKEMMSSGFEPADSVFNDGCYYTLTSDEAKNSTFGLKCVEEGDINNAFIFVKSEDDSYAITAVSEFSDKDLAGDAFDELYESLHQDEKSLKKKAKESDIEYGVGEDSDTAYTLLVISDNDYEMATGVYMKLDGKVLTVAAYVGTPKADLYTEYLDLMFDAKLQDMEALLD